jgi:hypothetical protein
MNPLTLYQEALDIVSRAVLIGDFDGYARMIDLPYLIHTENARHLISTVDDLRPTFAAVREVLAAQSITHYERVARAADYVQRDRIEGWHHTHLISHGERVACPHVSRHALVRRAGRWLFSEAHYAIRADRWPITREVLEDVLGLTLGKACES